MKKDQPYLISASRWAVVCILLCGCTSVHKPSGFFQDYAHLAKGKYFRQEYLAPGADFSAYQKVKVNPADLKYFENAYEKLTREELERLADRLKKALETQLAKHYQVLSDAENPDGHTLVVSPALVYVESPERLLNLATFWLIGLRISNGSAAFEAKLISGGSGKEIAQVAERRKSGGGITDIKSIFIGGWFRFIHAEGAFNRWGKNLVKFTSTGSN